MCGTFVYYHSNGDIDVSAAEAQKLKITFYNLMKEAINVLDETSVTFSIERIRNRWPMTVFLYCSHKCIDSAICEIVTSPIRKENYF